jgi:PIN domain nuclease of toxin-antitoxin system
VLLLDTHTALWLDSGAPMAGAALAAIEAAAAGPGVLLSPVSAWEIGLLAAKGRITLDLPAPAWLARFLALPGVRLAPLTPEAAVLAASLPGDLHADPADRLLAATARELGVPLVTRDARLLAYAAAGHLRAVEC